MVRKYDPANIARHSRECDASTGWADFVSTEYRRCREYRAYPVLVLIARFAPRWQIVEGLRKAY